MVVKDIEAMEIGIIDIEITGIVIRDIGVIVTGITDIMMETGTGEA